MLIINIQCPSYLDSIIFIMLFILDFFFADLNLRPCEPRLATQIGRGMVLLNAYARVWCGEWVGLYITDTFVINWSSTSRLARPILTRKAKSELFSALFKLHHLANCMYHRLEENEAKRSSLLPFGGDQIWICYRPPTAVVVVAVHYRDLRFGDPKNDGTRAYYLLINAILRGHFSSLHPEHYQDVFHYQKTRCCRFCSCVSHLWSCIFSLYVFRELLCEARDDARAEQLLLSVAKIVYLIIYQRRL